MAPFNYLKHFAVMPGVPLVMAPMIFVIEIISHLSRVLSLTLRLFGNIFGEHLVVLILASIVPFIAPLPIQFLGLIVGPLQAFIFLTLGAIYLTAATHVDDHGDEYGDDGGHPHAQRTDCNSPRIQQPTFQALIDDRIWIASN